MRKVVVLGIAAAVVVAGCGQKNETAAPSGTPTAAGKTWNIGYSQSTLQDPWRKDMNHGLEEEAKNHPEAHLLMQDAQNESNTQINQVESLQTQGIDALMISPNEAGPLTPVVSKLYKQGIPVIELDRATSGSDYTTLVGGDNTAIGKQAGEFVKKMFPNGAKIVEIAGKPGASATIERGKGFRDGIAGGKGLVIVASQPANYLRPQAIPLMQNLLQAHPDLQVVYAHNDEMALGAVKVLKSAGKKDVAVIGVDGQNEAIDAVANGDMAATFVYPRPGADGLKAALDILNKKRVPKRITLPTIQITKENAAQYKGKGF